MHFHLLTHTLRSSLLHYKHWPCLRNFLLHHLNRPRQQLQKWNIKRSNLTTNTTNVSTAWIQYHSQSSYHSRKPDISAFLPLTGAPIYVLSTQHHCIDIVEKTTQLLNPGQICVDESYQLVYKLLKEFRLRFRHRFGLINIFACLDFSYRTINPPSFWLTNSRK